jgi:hypothetical protein
MSQKTIQGMPHKISLSDTTLTCQHGSENTIVQIFLAQNCNYATQTTPCIIMYMHT